jgi:hypothetical protein
MASVAEDTDRLTRLMDRLLLDVSTLAAMNAGNAAPSLAAATPKRAGLRRSASNGAAPQQQEDGGGGADGGRSFTCWPALAELGGGGSSNGTPGRGGSGNHSAESTLVVCSMDMIASAFNPRGFNVLAMEGPGQGYTARFLGLHFFPDFERATSALYDYATTTLAVDASTVILWRHMPWLPAPRVGHLALALASLIAAVALMVGADIAADPCYSTISTGSLRGPTATIDPVSPSPLEFFDAAVDGLTLRRPLPTLPTLWAWAPCETQIMAGWCVDGVLLSNMLARAVEHGDRGSSRGHFYDLGLLRQFDVPPDDVTTFVDALAQPAAVLAVMKDRYRAEGPEAVRVGRQLLCDLAVHGPPTALEEQWASSPSEGIGATDAARADGMGCGVRQDALAGAGRGARSARECRRRPSLSQLKSSRKYCHCLSSITTSMMR